MLIGTPISSDYDRALDCMAEFFGRDENQDRVFSIFWSGWRPERRRVPLSDIDLFVCEQNNVMPPFEALEEFWQILRRIHSGLKIQVHWTSADILRSPLCPERPFLQEVMKWREGVYATIGFREFIEETAQRQEYKNDDISMISHYIRKIVSATIDLDKTKLHGGYVEIQRVLNAYRQIVSIITIIIRILEKESVFSSTKADVLDRFQKLLIERGINLQLDRGILLRFVEQDGEALIDFFSDWSPEEVIFSFQSAYRALGQIMWFLLALPVRKRTVEILSFE